MCVVFAGGREVGGLGVVRVGGVLVWGVRVRCFMVWVWRWGSGVCGDDWTCCEGR